MSQICHNCNIEKEISEYGIDRNNKDGYKKTCKKCLLEKIIAWQKKQPKGYWYRALKKRRGRLKEKYGIGGGDLFRYGVELWLYIYQRANYKCEICQNNKDLTVHHLDGNGRNLEKKGEQRKINNDHHNLVVLCRKCHGSVDGKKGQVLSIKRD